MPLVRVEIVERSASNDPDPEELPRLQGLTDRLGELFGTGPGRTWVRVLRIPRDQYAENGGPIAPDLAPVFVTVWKSSWDKESVASEMTTIAEAVGRWIGRDPANVHILFEPEAAGRIGFGGRLVP